MTDAPTPQTPQTDQGPKAQIKQTMQVLGKRSIFFPELAHERRPLTSKQKFQLAVDETIAPSRFIGSLFTAGISQARDSLPDYGQGWDGYGKRYGSSVASNASSHLLGTGVIPSLTHEDPRYFQKGTGSVPRRILWAASSTVWCRRDNGTWGPNYANVVGNMMGAAVSNLYYPSRERTFSNTADKWGQNIGIDAATFLFHEFWPDINHALFHGKKAN